MADAHPAYRASSGLPVPSLDDRTFDDLRAEALALLASYGEALRRDAGSDGLDDGEGPSGRGSRGGSPDGRFANAPAWTDHNASDPGITLIELFAWLVETLIYRADRITDDHLRSFLRLLHGPEPAVDPLVADIRWPPEQELEPAAFLREDVLATIEMLRHPYRVVTYADYERQALAAHPDVARVRCLPARRTTAGDEAKRAAHEAGHVSVVVVPAGEAAWDPPASGLRRAVLARLEDRRLLGTRVHVDGPVFASVQADLLIAAREDARPEQVAGDVADELGSFFDPLVGGEQGDGWPLGRDLYVSELNERIERAVKTVDHVVGVALTSRCPAAPGWRCAEVPQLWGGGPALVGVALAEHQLPRVTVSTTVAPARRWVGAQLRAWVRVADPQDEAAKTRVQRAAATRARDLFHPRRRGPDGESDLERELPRYEGAPPAWHEAPAPRRGWEISTATIADELAAVRGLTKVVEVELVAPVGRTRPAPEDGTLLHIEPEELVDVEVEVEAVT